MTKYEAVVDFTDAQDKTKDFPDGRIYRKGDAFPFEGKEVTEKRLEELATDKNRRKAIMIKSVAAPADDKTVAQLKEIADEKGLEYDPKILKADLLKLVKE